MAERKTAPKEQPNEEPTLDAASFLAFNAQQAVPFAGLLADEPDLGTEMLTAEEWRAKLDSYLKSDRP